MLEIPSFIDSQIVFFYTNDLKKTAAFYEELLELPLALDQGKCRIYQTAKQAYLGFCESQDVPEPTSSIITLVTQNVDELAGNLKSKGLRLEKEPAYNPEYQIYHCFFRDPNGYLIEIQRFEDPRWEG